jgi:hypothetical protein
VPQNPGWWGRPPALRVAAAGRRPVRHHRPGSGGVPCRTSHALDALRYLISKLDARLMARMRQPGSEKQLPPDPSASDPAPAPKARGPYVEGLVAALMGRTGARTAFVFTTSRVVFLLAPQVRHEAHFRLQGGELARHWGGQIRMCEHQFAAAGEA